MRARLLMAAGAALALAGCGSIADTGSGTGSGKAHSPTTRSDNALPRRSRLLRDVAEPLTGGYAAGGSLYYAEASPIGEHVGEAYRLTRLDPATGQVSAGRRFPAELGALLLAGGSLWATTSDGVHTTLWRLDPDTLALRSKIPLPNRRSTEGIAGTLAAAGGHLWVGAGTLDRVSLRSGRLQSVVTPPHPGPVGVAADSSGRTLMATFGYRDPTYVARLNPSSGATVARLKLGRSLGQPAFAGVTAGGAWLQNNTGHNTSALRVDVHSMRVTPTARWAAPSGHIAVQLDAGRLWVTEQHGAANINYCASPVTGRVEAKPALLPGDSVLLAADRSDFYYTDVPVNAHAVKLEQAPISAGCGG